MKLCREAFMWRVTWDSNEEKIKRQQEFASLEEAEDFYINLRFASNKLLVVYERTVLMFER